LTNTIGGHSTDLLRSRLTAFGQLAHFRCHDSKTSAVFACPRNFDCCIQRQQIGLAGNVVDDARPLDNYVQPLSHSY
jgi:hypothetical protein